MSRQKDTPLWMAYEEQVAQLVASFDAGAEVVHNKRVEARLSRVMRQVDVWVCGRVIGQEIIIVVECKLVSRPLDIGTVDEFVGKLLDIGADRGVLYSASGMTPNAVHRAEMAVNPSIIPVSLEPAPERFPVPGVPVGLDEPDYAGWMTANIYRWLITSMQWLPYYARDEIRIKDERWANTALPDWYELE